MCVGGGEGTPPEEDIRPDTKLLWPFLFPQGLLLSVDCETQKKGQRQAGRIHFSFSLDTLRKSYTHDSLWSHSGSVAGADVRQPYLLWVNDIICRVGKRKDAFSK